MVLCGTIASALSSRTVIELFAIFLVLFLPHRVGLKPVCGPSVRIRRPEIAHEQSPRDAIMYIRLASH